MTVQDGAPGAFRPTPLFGGAITANLPSSFTDASNIRDVPSNQEVYLCPTNDTTLIVEILEYAAPPAHPCATDEEALRYHYNDMVEAGYTSSRGDVEEVTKFFHEGLGERSGVDVPSLAEVDGAKVLGCLGVQMPVATTADAGAGGGGGKKTNFTALLMTLIRLPSKETDILLTIAVPHVVGEYDAGSVALESEKRGPLIEEGMEIRREALKGFEIRDWGLFDG